MPSGTWYIISREIQNSHPQYPPNDAQNTPKIPPKTSYLGPPKGLTKFGNYDITITDLVLYPSETCWFQDQSFLKHNFLTLF